MSGPATPKTAAAAGRAKRRDCPICGRKAGEDAYPFCSERCADVDLHRWLSGAYVVSGADDDEAEAGPPRSE